VVSRINFTHITIFAHRTRSSLGAIGTQSVPEDVTWFIVIETHVRFDHVVPVNNLIDRTELIDSPFNLANEQFDFPVRPGVFHPGDDMYGSELIQELLEHVYDHNHQRTAGTIRIQHHCCPRQHLDRGDRRRIVSIVGIDAGKQFISGR